MAGFGKRHLLCFCASFVAVALIYSLCGTALAFIAAFVLFTGAFAFLLCFTGNRATAAAVIIAAVLSLLWQTAYYEIASVPESLFNKRATVDAEITSYSEQTESGMTYVTAEVIYEGKRLAAALYTSGDTPLLSPGDIITAELSFSKLENDEFFAEETYYKSRYIDVIAFADEIEILESSSGFRWRYIPIRVAKAFKDKMDAIYPDKVSGFLKSLILGDRSGLSDDFNGALKTTGMSHVVSVSGMHIAFLVGFIVSFSKNKYFKLCSIPLILLFALIVGAPQSALRAVIMQTLLVLASVSKREYDKLTSVAFSAFILVAINPYCITDIAFVLSFSATIGIILLYERLLAALLVLTVKTKSILRKFSVGAMSVISVSVSASLFTSPISAYSFGYISLIAPIVNVILNIFVSCAFTLGFINTAVGFISLPLAKGVAVLSNAISEFIMFAINIMSKLPFSVVSAHNPLVLVLICFICFVLAYAIIAGRERVRIWYTALVLMLAVSAVFIGAYIQPVPITAEGIRFDVLDVGQGQCVIASAGDQCVVIDCGGSKDAGNIAISHLLDNGIKDIDAVVLTHAHADHANGVRYLTETIPTSAVYMPATDKENATFIHLVNNADEACDMIFVEKDTELELGEIKIKLLTLPQGSDENENGITVIVCDDEYETLITGDIASGYEKLILERLPDCESYIVGHHGSKSSSSQALLNRALPELCVISVGEGNSYGHPSDEALDRIENIGANVSRTDVEGTVTFYSRKQEDAA